MWYLLVLIMFTLIYLWLLSLLGYNYYTRFRCVFIIYLILLSFISFIRILNVCSDFIYCLLLVNFFISMYVLSRSYGVSVYLLIVLFFKVLAEILLFISYGLFLSLDGLLLLLLLFILYIFIVFCYDNFGDMCKACLFVSGMVLFLLVIIYLLIGIGNFLYFIVFVILSVLLFMFYLFWLCNKEGVEVVEGFCNKKLFLSCLLCITTTLLPIGILLVFYFLYDIFPYYTFLVSAFDFDGFIISFKGYLYFIFHEYEILCLIVLLLFFLMIIFIILLFSFYIDWDRNSSFILHLEKVFCSCISRMCSLYDFILLGVKSQENVWGYYLLSRAFVRKCFV